MQFQPFVVEIVRLLLLVSFLATIVILPAATTTTALPLSQPYIAYRTDAYHHNQSHSNSGLSSGSGGFVIHNAKYNWEEEYEKEFLQQQQQQQQQSEHRSYMYNKHDNNMNNIDPSQPHHKETPSKCPLEFTIGTSQRIHSSSTTTASSSWTQGDLHPHDSSSSSIVVSSPPLILPIPPRGGGVRLDNHHKDATTAAATQLDRKQIVFTTNYEHLDLYYSTSTSGSSRTSSSGSTTTPITKSQKQQPRRNIINRKNRLQQDLYYPLLFESSVMTHLHPILYDVNYDGIHDIIVTDYDGGITVVSSGTGTGHDHKNHKAYHHTQVPRLYIRREWMEHYYYNSKNNDSATATLTVDVITNASDSSNSETQPDVTKHGKSLPHDPFHSYFEYYYASSSSQPNMDLIRGHSVNVLHQDTVTHETLQDHRRRVQSHNNANSGKRRLLEEPASAAEQVHPMVQSSPNDATASLDETPPRIHRRLQEVVDTEEQDEEMEENNMGIDDVGIPELIENNNNNLNGDGNNYDDDAAKLRDMDDQQHQFDRNPNHHQEEEDGRESESEEDISQEEQWQPPQHDDPILADIRNKQEQIMKQESLQNDEGADGTEKHDLPIIQDVDQMPRGMGDDMAYDGYDGEEPMMDDYAMYARHGDDMYPGGGADHAYNDYYDSKHYIRLPPHILTTPTLVEVPKLYSSDKYEKEDMLFVAVSYYFDEDEYDGLLSSYQRFYNTDVGDETEARRGSYIANAIMVYVIGSDGGTSQRWTGQTHLDLSSDYTAPENITVVGNIPIHSDVTQMSALALSSPTIVDLDGDGKLEAIIGTNMGILYVFDARQMLLQRENWPIQMLHPIEHPILVEDVIGTTSLEMFVADVGGTVACLNHRAEVLWQHNLVLYLPLNTEHNIDPTATSPMTLGDVDGDGLLDIVQMIRTQSRSFIFAVTASTGDMLANYPIELDGNISLDDEAEEVHYKLTQPLLVDLHTDHSFLNAYLHRNGGTKFTRPTTKTSTTKTSKGTAIAQGGIGSGLHIVVPHGHAIFIVEGSTGCTQKIDMDTEVVSMVQVDDLHGTDHLDLVIVTGSGNVMTLETNTPYHPLNTWTGGPVRNHRSTSHVHGYSASQGIFVHDITRQYTDIFGVYVPITFEIFDNRPNIQNEPEQRKYLVEVRDGPSWKRALWRNSYNATGVYTERVYVRYGPGYYTLYVTMQTSHGIIYEDTFSIGYNIHFLDGLDVYLWLPLLIAAIIIFVLGASKRPNWNSIHDIDEQQDNHVTEYYDNGRDGHSLGILGRAQLPT